VSTLFPFDITEDNFLFINFYLSPAMVFHNNVLRYTPLHTEKKSAKILFPFHMPDNSFLFINFY